MKDFMKEALKEARKSFDEGEVPIGAVIVQNGKIIARGRNKRERSQVATKHAEIIAIERACKKLHSWRIENATIYVTLEPCPMCAGGILNARIDNLVYGAKEKTSGDNLCEKILSSRRLNHETICSQDEIHREECEELLTQFFKNKRKK